MSSDTPIRIAVASGKGGTGKTMLATNLFYVLQQHHEEVMLIDCDAEAPNDKLFFTGILEDTVSVTQKVPVIDESRCTYCGRCHEYCAYHAIFSLPELRVIQLIEDLCHGCGACSAACLDKAITEREMHLGQVRRYSITSSASLVESRMHTGVYSPVSVIKAAIREGKGHKHIILDAPPGTSCPFIHSVFYADYVILITEPSPFGFSDLLQSIAVLNIMKKAFGVVINRSGIGNDQVYTYLKQEELPLLMDIPFNREIATAYAHGMLWATIDNSFSNELYQLYHHVICQLRK